MTHKIQVLLKTILKRAHYRFDFAHKTMSAVNVSILLLYVILFIDLYACLSDGRHGSSDQVATKDYLVVCILKNIIILYVYITICSNNDLWGWKVAL